MRTLICNGDSWTFGSEIVDPELDCVEISPLNDPYRVARIWPSHLGDLLNANVVNLAWPADDNNTILQRTISYLTQNYIAPGKSVKDLLVVVGWTSPERNSLQYNDGKVRERFRIWPQLAHVRTKTQKKIWSYYVDVLWNKEEYISRHVMNVLTLQSFCEAHGIDWMCFNAFYQTPATDISGWKSVNLSDETAGLLPESFVAHEGSERQPHYYDWASAWDVINPIRFYRKDKSGSTFKDFIDGQLSDEDRYCGWHPSPKGHQIWADELYRYYGEMK